MHTFTLPDKRHVFFVEVFSQTVQRNTVYVVAEYIQYEGLKDKHNINYRQHVNFTNTLPVGNRGILYDITLSTGHLTIPNVCC